MSSTKMPFLPQHILYRRKNLVMLVSRPPLYRALSVVGGANSSPTPTVMESELQEPLSARVRKKRDGDHLHQLTSDSRRLKGAGEDKPQELP